MKVIKVLDFELHLTALAVPVLGSTAVCLRLQFRLKTSMKKPQMRAWVVRGAVWGW